MTQKIIQIGRPRLPFVQLQCGVDAMTLLIFRETRFFGVKDLVIDNPNVMNTWLGTEGDR